MLHRAPRPHLNSLVKASVGLSVVSVLEHNALLTPVLSLLVTRPSRCVLPTPLTNIVPIPVRWTRATNVVILVVDGLCLADKFRGVTKLTLQVRFRHLNVLREAMTPWPFGGSELSPVPVLVSRVQTRPRQVRSPCRQLVWPVGLVVTSVPATPVTHSLSPVRPR